MWFQDGTRILVSGRTGTGDETAIWIVSVADGTIRKVFDQGHDAAPSPDGKWISFRTSKGNEIWLMGANGENAHKLFAAPPGTVFRRRVRLAWSPDGRRIAYLKLDTATRETSIASFEIESRRSTLLLSMDGELADFCWASDGRLIFSLQEVHDPLAYNLWTMQVDNHTGLPLGSPRRLTNIPGSQFSAPTVSANGKRLTFIKGKYQSDTWAATLESAPTRLSKSWRLTRDEWWDGGWEWTKDSRTIFFESNRSGDFDIFQQDLESSIAQPVVGGRGDQRMPQLSPDGLWILYLDWPASSGGFPSSSGRLMRAPLSGGSPEMIFEVAGHPGVRRVSEMGRAYPSFRCPSVSTNPCILAELEPPRIVFSTFDPLGRRKARLLAVEMDSSKNEAYRFWQMEYPFWDLSPDGSHIAFGERNERASIWIIPVAGGPRGEIVIEDRSLLESLSWAADGKGFFLTAYRTNGSPLLHVSLDGRAILLRTAGLWFYNPTPSRDGRHLAFSEITASLNAWMIDNF